MKFIFKSGLALIPALALAAPAFAQVRPTTLSDSQEPGSVIVFPKFIKGTVTLPEGPAAARSEMEIGIVCPKGAICSEHQAVKIRFHWVCGTTEADIEDSFVCKETDFDVNATVFEKIVLVPDGSLQIGNVNTKTVGAAQCDRGYLIGWVIRPSDDRPIKFDGLVGDATLRETATSLASYSAIPIQANPASANLAPIDTNMNGALVFDGGTNHYQAVAGTVLGDVRYSNPAPGTVSPVVSDGSLTLLTLNVRSNRSNFPTWVDLDFFGGNPSAIGNENQLSTSLEFICWTETRLTDIDSNLTTAVMGRKGVFVSAPAAKEPIGGFADTAGPVTLLGLFETTEGAPATQRAYYNNLFNDSNSVVGRFRPSPSPIFLQ
jgi:hypothetical protein